ncbi:uncharacterized protein LOC116249298 isoform X1 [Nymphaea colorata]|nr:uncharacterized protein LOC116249298 isoform X1 [Nymphaea colorata]
MDLLRGAYGAASDEEEEEGRRNSSDRFSKRHRPLPVAPPLPGCYVSKRQRAAMAATTAAQTLSSSQTSAVPSPVVSSSGSISDADLPPLILSSSRRKGNFHANQTKIPERCSVYLTGHSKAVNAIHWCPTTAHLLASAGMDQTICVWNVWTRGQKKVRTFHGHNAAVMDVRWSQHGLYLLTCGYDSRSRFFDVEKGVEIQHFEEDQIVRVVRFHPENSNLFLSGGSNGSLRLWDIRVNKVVKEYVRKLGPILDIDISVNGKQFISSSNVSKDNASENSVIVWDIARQVPLSYQVYVEAYTCTSVRYHPFDPCFVAQSNGNYVAIFSSMPPFKLDKYRRYEKHGVAGFPVKCNFNLSGDILISGSSDGCVYFYDYKSTNLLRKMKAYDDACLDVACHPVMPNVLATSSWNGDVLVFE